MRGIFFSIDAILALLIAFSLSAFILNAIAQIPDAGASLETPQKIAEDALASMEKMGVLKATAASTSAIPLKEFARIMPENLCYRISIYNSSDDGVLVAQENCPCSTFSVSRRSFIVAEPLPSIYLAEMHACHK